MTFKNPYPKIPENEDYHIMLHSLRSDVEQIKSVLVDRGTFVNLFNPIIQHLADYVRTHQLTYTNRADLIAYIERGLTNFSTPIPNRHLEDDGRPNAGEGKATPILPHVEPDRPASPASGGRVTQGKVATKRTYGRGK